LFLSNGVREQRPAGWSLSKIKTLLFSNKVQQASDYLFLSKEINVFKSIIQSANKEGTEEGATFNEGNEVWTGPNLYLRL
jgi:hypothetical protein